jgi:hypothetical protein
MLNVPDFVTLQPWYAMPWFNMVRFGKWDEILAITEPQDSFKTRERRLALCTRYGIYTNKQLPKQKMN